MKDQTKTSDQLDTKNKSKPRGRPVTNDIMNLQGSIPTTPEKLARVILSTPPGKGKD